LAIFSINEESDDQRHVKMYAIGRKITDWKNASGKTGGSGIVKVKESRNSPDAAQRVPGGLGSQIL